MKQTGSFAFLFVRCGRPTCRRYTWVLSSFFVLFFSVPRCRTLRSCFALLPSEGAAPFVFKGAGFDFSFFSAGGSLERLPGESQFPPSRSNR